MNRKLTSAWHEAFYWWIKNDKNTRDAGHVVLVKSAVDFADEVVKALESKK